MDVRIGWASFDAAAAPTDVRIGWAEFDATAQPMRVCVGWAELDVRAVIPQAPLPPPRNYPDDDGLGYHRSYSHEQYLIPVQLDPDATDIEEEEIILALLMEIATHVV